jgi:hypothetical protein
VRKGGAFAHGAGARRRARARAGARSRLQARHTCLPRELAQALVVAGLALGGLIRRAAAGPH